MGNFAPVPDLENKVARMVADDVREVARSVEHHARRLAPPGKKWVSMADNRVRLTHRGAHNHEMIPANLRFAVQGTEWDIAHGLSPGIDYLWGPKDTSTGLPPDSVQHVYCRCVVAFDPAFIAKGIRTEPTRIHGTEVTVEVTATAPHVVQAENGDVYGPGVSSPGTHFMSKAAARAAGAGGYGPAIDWTRAPAGGTGDGSENNHG